MTREEAIKTLANATIEPTWGGSFSATSEALKMAIEALKRERTDEWCTGCKEYDTEKKCCPRFNKVIREALKREPSEDGTLKVKVEDATKIGRVLISDDKHRGGLYYPDEYGTQGDLISRADAIEAMGEEPPVWCDEEYEIAERSQWRDDVEAIKSVPSADRPTDGDLISRQAAIDALYDKGSSMTAWGELLAMKWSDIQKCIEQLPSADRPMVIKCKPFLSEEDFKAFAEQVSDQNVILIPYEAEVVSTNTSTKSTNTSTKSTNISTDASADRPRGEWIEETSWKYKKGGRNSDMKEILGTEWMTMIRQRCSECNKVTMVDGSILYKYCPHCGAKMDGERSEK